ncbi:MAG: DUF386 family protein, partial [Sphingobacteriales bacterium]
YKCTVSAGDDAICMKSSSTARITTTRLENVIVAGCTVYRGHGGFVIGSNTDGGMNNILVADCNFIGTDIGIRVKSNAGRGGLVRNVFIRDIFMSDITGEAISFDTYYEDVTAGKEKGDVKTTAIDKVPEFRDFYFRNIYGRGARTAIFINGLPQMPVHHIYFENLLVSADKAFDVADFRDIAFRNAKVLLPGGNTRVLAPAELLLSQKVDTPPMSNDPLYQLPAPPHASVNRAEFNRQYAANPKLWNKAFEFLRTQKLSALEPGKYLLAGDSVFVSVTYGPVKAFDSTKWEAHRKYIDLQYVISGEEKMGVAPLAKATEIVAYNEAKDLANYTA